MRDVIRRFPWLFEVLIGMLALGAVLKWINSPGAPVEVISYTVLTPSIYAGGEMQVSWLLNRKRACQLSTIRKWEDSNGKEIMRLPPRPAATMALGVVRFTTTVPVPPKSGRMCYTSDVHYRCEDGGYTVSTPDICVDVLPAVKG